MLEDALNYPLLNKDVEMEKPNFLNQIASFMWQKRYAKRTIESYIYWISAYIKHFDFEHPERLSSEHVELFLSYLVQKQKVAASTQTMALNALNFLYKDFLAKPLAVDLNFVRSKRFKKLPVVLTQEEVKCLLKNVPASLHLPVSLLYGSGLRLMECVRLRVGDIDFDYKSIRVWNGKGGRHRIVTLSEKLLVPLQQQISEVSRTMAIDINTSNYAGVWMPDALFRKYPNAKTDVNWQYLFPSARLSKDPQSLLYRRHQ